ncbi:MFSD1 [Cordylochernes scorpioides]|uniref:MFSD1 n=1 Tax=Cordylochernes scorpioides TaxID=51811 RepID=A0ABY6L077_9ARAC|nr:MFSD1 [Cordylochernes scorpioides]
MAYLDKRRDRVLALDAVETAKMTEQPAIKIKDVIEFPSSFWMICLICVTFYIAIFPFVALGTVFFVRKFGLSPSEANTLDGVPGMTINWDLLSNEMAPQTITPCCGPVWCSTVRPGSTRCSGRLQTRLRRSSGHMGLLVDYFGYNLSWLASAIVVTIGAHMLLAFTTLNPWVAVVILGLAYTTVACSLWPLVPLIIPSHQHGTAYGLVQALQNLGLGAVTLLAGYIVDSKGYLFLEIFFIDCLFGEYWWGAHQHLSLWRFGVQ